MIHQTSGYVIVVITALEENFGISIYERVATQVYDMYFQEKEIAINKIIWIEQIIQKEGEKAFFEVNLSWDETLQFFHSPQWGPCDEKTISVIRTFCSKPFNPTHVH